MMRPPFDAAPSDSPDEEVERQIVLAYIELYRAAQRYTEAQTAEYGVTAVQLAALGALAKKGPMTIRGLAAALQARHSTTSELCDRLTRARLVKKVRCEKDRRAVEVALSKEGRSIVGRARVSPVDLMRRVLKPFNRTEKEQLLGLIRKARRAIGARVGG